MPELGETEVGYLLGRPYWGRGYATAAARLSLDFAFTRCDLDHVIGLVHPANLASRRVLEKFGLLYQEILPLWGMDLMRYTLPRPTEPIH